jgi:SAM-dependent methyltransferase
MTINEDSRLLHRVVNISTRKGSKAKQFFVQTNYHEYWNEKVNKKGYEEPHFRVFIEMLQLSKTDSVLEVGAGGGRVYSAIRDNVSSYVGVDISLEALKAEPFTRHSGMSVNLIVADASALPFVNSCFDKSFSFSTLFFVPDQAGAMREIARVSEFATVEFANRLSVGGIIVLMRRGGLILFDSVKRVMGLEIAIALVSLFLGREKTARLASYSKMGLIQPYFPVWSWTAISFLRDGKMVVRKVRGFGGRPWWLASKIAISGSRVLSDNTRF